MRGRCAVRERELTLAFPAGSRVPEAQGRAGGPPAGYRRGAADGDRPALSLRYELREVQDAEDEAGTRVLSGEELVRRFMEEFDAEELPEDDDPEQDGGR